MKNIFSYPSIAILGSTGSVGKQAIDVARANHITIKAICADQNTSLVEAQVREFHIPYCAMRDENAAMDLKIRLRDTDTTVFSGSRGIEQMILACDAQTVINAISGEAGLQPTLQVLASGKTLALANKESLVVAGDLVMALSRQQHSEILPVDSEHCAIFQALRSGHPSEIKKIILTASGGPFFGYTREQLNQVTVQQTLSHPTWNMGNKITVDSATLMNKGFEVIEAVHLFGVRPEQIQVVVHRESVIHSAVEFLDHSVIAQLAVPDMRACVQYALTHPCRTSAVVGELDLLSVAHLSFFKPDTECFPLLSAAVQAIGIGGAVPAVLNAANEVAVAAFLQQRLSFPGISDTVMRVTEQLSGKAKAARTLEEILNYDREARSLAASFIR